MKIFLHENYTGMNNLLEEKEIKELFTRNKYHLAKEPVLKLAGTGSVFSNIATIPIGQYYELLGRQSPKYDLNDLSITLRGKDSGNKTVEYIYCSDTSETIKTTKIERANFLEGGELHQLLTNDNKNRNRKELYIELFRESLRREQEPQSPSRLRSMILHDKETVHSLLRNTDDGFYSHVFEIETKSVPTFLHTKSYQIDVFKMLIGEITIDLHNIEKINSDNQYFTSGVNVINQGSNELLAYGEFRFMKVFKRADFIASTGNKPL